MHAAAIKDLPPVILASASPRRAQLLRQLGIDFTVVPSQSSEVFQEQLTAREVAQINAYRKARFVAKRAPDALVIGADTVVALDTRLFAKPTGLEDAYRMLEELQNRTHIVVTGICLICLRQHRQSVFSESTDVTFRALDSLTIRRYLNHVDPLDKAGGYGIQDQGEMIVERIDGSYTNVVGLPLERLQLELTAWSSTPPPQAVAPFIAALPGVTPHPHRASPRT